MIQLGVNIDHVATLRQARRTYEPDPLWAAVEAQLAGADLITMHLREDRRHVQDHDLRRARQSCQVPLNMEMAATNEMVAIAAELRPRMCTLVPEGRQEVTTEGGLDVAGQLSRLKDVTAKLRQAGIETSAFIDADEKQVDASVAAGFAMCEIHTGPYASAFEACGGDLDAAALKRELDAVAKMGQRIVAGGLRFNAGHALNYRNVQPIAALPGVRELHIGHSIISRSVFVGLRQAVAEMKQLMKEAAGVAAGGSES
jgi:pyridoxine 5-phosphate synthase